MLERDSMGVRQIPEQMPAVLSFSFCAAGRGAPMTMAGG